MTWAMTWYRRLDERRPGLRVVYDADELAHALSTPAPMRGAKRDLPAICPATYRGDLRSLAAVESVSMLGLDLDEPTADPAHVVAAVHDALGGVDVYAYSTSSSGPDAYRLRVLVPYDRPASADEHRVSWALVARVLARAGVTIDRACSDASRGYYVWCVPPSGAYYHAHLAGEPWPVAMAAATETEIAALATPPARPVLVRPTSDVMQRARAYVARMPAAISGSGGHAATWAVARVLVADFGLDDEAAMEVLVEYSARCQPPWSIAALRHKVQSARSARVRRAMEIR